MTAKTKTKAFDASKYLTDLGGRDYLEVKWRLLWLRTEHPDAVVETELVKHGTGLALFRARVTVPGGGTASGWGSETAEDFGDFIEKAETKALGRALAALGYGTQFCEDFDFSSGSREQRATSSNRPQRTGRVVDAPVAEMPFADHSSLIPALPQRLGEGGQAPIQPGPERRHVVDVAVGPGQDRRAAWSADRVGAEAVVEAHPLLGDAVEVGRLVDPAAVAAHGVGCVVVGHYEQDVRPVWAQVFLPTVWAGLMKSVTALPEQSRLELMRRGWDSNPRSPVKRNPVFKTGALSRSATPPGGETLLMIPGSARVDQPSRTAVVSIRQHQESVMPRSAVLKSIGAVPHPVESQWDS